MRKFLYSIKLTQEVDFESMMNKNPQFVGRSGELAELTRLTKKKTASLVVVKGRRRIGKSRLIEEFAKSFPHYQFLGLPPDKNTTAESQRKEFLRQFSEQLNFPPIQTNDWGDIFTLLGKMTQQGRLILILDEITWMGSKDPDFLGKLEIAWEKYFSKNPELILILCGSVSIWIENNILSSTGYFGRVACEISLDELSLRTCNKLMQKLAIKSSPLEKLSLLSITGGVPWYIELFNPSVSLLENVKSLCFRKNGILVKEFRRLFHDLFGKRGDIYQKIIEILAIAPRTYDELSKLLKYSSGGPLSGYLSELQMSSFISRDYAWNFKTKAKKEVSHFRLRDNYLRFYFKCIHPHLDQIERDNFRNRSLNNIPGWQSILGLQFQNLVLQNRSLIWDELNINHEEIVNDNPFLQRASKNKSGCQIDYLIQTRLKLLYICEIKFSQNTIGIEVIKDVKEKIKRLKKPRGFACNPVLICVGEVSNAVLDANFFTHIINIADLIKNNND